jgi:aerobic-type carbon monoxide dehydrogenase small subunit (CoxS/CutS family)
MSDEKRKMEEAQQKAYGHGRIPPMIVCPYCQPGTISYAGVVISRVCSQCRAELRENR